MKTDQDAEMVMATYEKIIAEKDTRIAELEKQLASRVQLCPKCNGQGIVSKPPGIAGDVTQWISNSSSHVCDVCNGQKILSASQFYTPDQVRQMLESLKKECVKIEKLKGWSYGKLSDKITKISPITIKSIDIEKYLKP